MRAEFEAADASLKEGFGPAEGAGDEALWQEILRQRIRLYEAGGRLPELETDLRAAARSAVGGQFSLRALARFYGETARPADRMAELIRLDEAGHGRAGGARAIGLLALYAFEFETARKYLDRALEEAGDGEREQAALERARVDLMAGDAAAARVRVEALMEGGGSDKRMIAFCIDHHLDGLAERRLKKHLAESGGGKEETVRLAEFYAARARRGDLRGLLEKAVSKARERPARVEAMRFKADTLFQLGDLEGALETRKRMVALEPASPVHWRGIGEIEALIGRTDAALRDLEMAWGLEEGRNAREEIDRRIFSLLGASSARRRQGESAASRRFRASAAGVTGDDPGAGEPEEFTPELQRFSHALSMRADANPTAPNLYRAARWAFRLRDYRRAYAHISQASRLAPDSLDIGELLLELAVKSGNRSLALRQLRLLESRDPARAVYCKAMRARLEMGRRNVEEGVRILNEIADAPDATVEHLSIAAHVYEQIEYWEGALKLWNRALDKVGGQNEKMSLVRQISRTLASAKRPDQALEIYQQAVLGEPGMPARLAWFDRLLKFAATHRRLPWLESHYRELLDKQPADGFVRLALARIRFALRRADEAAALLKQAVALADDPAPLLDDLVTAAAGANDFAAAIHYQRRRLYPMDLDAMLSVDFSQWGYLAMLKESALEMEESDQAWRDLRRLFNRHTHALTLTADHYLETRQWNEVIVVLRHLRDLRPSDHTVAVRLGRILRHLRRFDEAEGVFLDLLRGSRGGAVKPGDTRFPIFSSWRYQTERRAMLGNLDDTPGLAPDSPPRARLRAFLELPRPECDPRATGEEAIRLQALEELGQIARQEPSRKPRILRQAREVLADAATERLWLYNGLGMWKELAPALDQSGGSSAGAFEHGFSRCLLALRHRAFADIAGWVQAGTDPSARRRMVVIALSLLADSAPAGSVTSPEFSRGLVALLDGPAGFEPDSIWRLARKLSRSRAPALAVPVGDAAFRKAGHRRIAFALPLAGWAARGGDFEKARAYLESVLDTPEAAVNDSTCHVFCSALATLHRIAGSARDRDALIRSVRSNLGILADASSKPLTEGVLALLKNDDAAAARAAEDLVAEELRASRGIDHLSRPPRGGPVGFEDPPERFWNVILRHVIEMREIGFARWACLVGQLALDHAVPAGVEDSETEAARMRLEDVTLSLQCESLSHPERDHRLQEFLARRPASPGDPDHGDSPPDALQAAGRLMHAGFPRQAATAFQHRLSQDPRDQRAFAGLVRAAEAALEPNAAIERIRTALMNPELGPKEAKPDDLHRAYARLLRLSGKAGGLARRADMYSAGPRRGIPYLRELASLQFQAGDFRGAAKTYSELSQKTMLDRASSVSYARALQALGSAEGAIRILERIPIPENYDPTAGLTFDLLATLYAAAGQRGKLTALCREVARRRLWGAVPSLREKLAGNEYRDLRRGLLSAASRRAAAPMARIQSQILLALDDDEDDGLAAFESFLVAEESSGTTLAVNVLLRQALEPLAADPARAGFADRLAALCRRSWTPDNRRPVAALCLGILYARAPTPDPGTLDTLVDEIVAAKSLRQEQLHLLAITFAALDKLDAATRIYEHLVRSRPDSAARWRIDPLRLRILKHQGKDEEVRSALIQRHRWRALLGDRPELLPRLCVELGEPGLADTFSADVFQSIPTATKAALGFLQDYASRLTGAGELDKASAVLRVLYSNAVEHDPAPLLKFLKAKGSLVDGSWKREADAFFLSSGLRARLEAMAGREVKQ